MHRIILYLIFCFLSATVLAQGSYRENLDSESTQPNFVLILVDDAALMDFGIYGGEAHTPHIDALASAGTMFTHYRASLMCAPSRSMLLTGFDSHLTGIPNLPLFTSRELAKRPGYEGVLNDKVETIGTRLKRHGYRTYVTGKWHLGHTAEALPSKRGFDRTYILDASGADNYEQRPYLPTQESKPPWFKDGEAIDLPEDFYSSRNLVDEMIQFMEEEDQDSDPFFSFLSFQAIHIPVQAPLEYTERYISTYEEGWDALKRKRFARAKKLGLISENANMGKGPNGLKKWDDLDDEEKKFMAKVMAVNAGMLEAMDHHIGRYVDYLKTKGKYDNTIFIITSDNGPEASSAGDVNSMKLWLKWVGYHRDYDRLGERGSFNYIGPEFASAAAGPSSFFKFYAGEGGVRVPLIFSGPGIPQGQSQNAFSRVTDIVPTILSLAGVDQPKEVEAGPMTGRSLYPLLNGSAETVYSMEEPIGIEAAGHAALYKGDLKLVRNGRPYGDGQWRLYNLKIDPGETIDLSESSSSKFEELSKDYSDYADAYGVVEMGEDYEPFHEIQNKLVAKIKKAVVPWMVGFIILFVVFLVGRKTNRRTPLTSL